MPVPRFLHILTLQVVLLAAACQDTHTPVVPPPVLSYPAVVAGSPRGPLTPLLSRTDPRSGGDELQGCTPLIEFLLEYPQTSVALHVDRKGTAYLAYDVRDDGSAGIHVATDADGTWKVEPVARLANVWVDDIQTDPAGGLHLLYTDVSTGRVVHASRPPGGAWTSSAVGQGHGAALAIDEEGTIHVVHRSPDATGSRYARRVGGTWRSEPVDPVTAPTHVALGLDRQGRVHLAYVGSRATQLFHAVRGPQGWTRTLIANRAGQATFQGVDVAFAPGDEPAVAYVSSGDTLYLAERGGGTWRTAPVLENVDYLREVSLAIDAGGNHHVGYMRGDYSAAYATDREGPWRHLPLLASSFAPASLALTPSSQPVLAVLSSSRGVVGLARPCPSRASRSERALPWLQPSAPTTRGLAAP
ncbi:hypothetical protein P2318_31180 [Myxococcaceae bacterium GXIMD 01537]